MSRSNRSILRLVLVLAAGVALAVFGSRSSTQSGSLQPTSQEPEPKEVKHDCEIDGSLKSLRDCPAETIIAQYKERYGVTVALRDGAYWQVVSGEYVNQKYGYQVILPDSVEALCTPPPMPWHGFFVDVVHDPPPTDERAIRGGLTLGLSIEAHYNWFRHSADELANYILGCYEKDYPDLTTLTHDRTTLRKLPASYYRVQFAETTSGESMVEEGMVAVRGGEEGIIYSIVLTTTPARYSQDEKVLRAILKGFRFTRPE